jgi:methylaspartate mutase epsilon subunit
MEVKNKKFTEEEFFKERKEVLAQWPTGEGVNLQEAIDFHKKMPATKNYAKKLAWASKNGTVLIRSDSGIPALDEHIEYIQYLQDKGGIDLLCTMIDSFTRTQRYKESEKKLEESIATGKWLLNGVPLVAYGVANTRRIVDSVNLPVALRGNALDFRLVVEIALAGGHTDISSSPILSFWHYSSKDPPEISIHNQQYNYRLMGYYEENGVPMSCVCIGGFTIINPFSAVQSAIVIEALLAA